MSEAERLHRHLVGQQGSRRSLNTPALVIDVEMLDRNIAEMAVFARAHGVKLRPHSKTHKSLHVALRQIASGAVGICCAKLGEAEALGSGGVESLLVTSPVVTPPAIARLIALNQAIADLMVVVDHPENVEALSAAAESSRKPLTVIVDIDPGMHRTGVASPAGGVALARDVSRRSFLKYAGVQFYYGNLQHIASYAERKAAIEDRTGYLRGILDQLQSADLTPRIVTGGGTGTHHIDASLGALTELQVGSYVFMDRQYHACDLHGSGRPVFEQALQIDTRVVSVNTPGMVTIDAGLKAMATEAGPPWILEGAPDHGALVTLAPPHCDPTVNLYESFHVVKGDTLVDIWPVTARGRSR